MEEEKQAMPAAEQKSPSADLAPTCATDHVEMPDANDGRFIFYGWIVIVSIFGILGVWMAFAPLDSASVAAGKVAVEGKKKSIQHLEGGIVEAIYVKDGDKVTKGQILLKIDEVRAKSHLGTVLSQYYEALAMENRLVAERDGLASIVFDREIEDLEDGLKRKLVDGQTRLFTSRKDAQNSEKEIMLKRITQLEKQIEGNRSIIKSKQSRLRSYSEEIEEWKVLYEEQLTDKLKLRELQRDVETIEGDIASSEAEIARLYVQINETQSQILLVKHKFINEIGSQLREVQTSLADMRARLFSLRDTLKRTSIIAPVDGVVVGMDAAHSVGGVIAPGRTLLEIVPGMSEMIVIAQVQTTDIDKVTRGLKANVRFSAFNLKMAHVVEGEVIHVSADSFIDEVTGMPYYEAEVKLTEEGRKQLKENNFFLIPGMPAEVMIKTGKRTVLDYLLKPMRTMFSKAFRED